MALRVAAHILSVNFQHGFLLSKCFHWNFNFLLCLALFGRLKPLWVCKNSRGWLTIDRNFLTSLLKTIDFDFCELLSLFLIMSIFTLHFSIVFIFSGCEVFVLMFFSRINLSLFSSFFRANFQDYWWVYSPHSFISGSEISCSYRRGPQISVLWVKWLLDSEKPNWL